jgi:hypothetical protein
MKVRILSYTLYAPVVTKVTRVYERPFAPKFLQLKANTNKCASKAVGSMA